MTFSRRLCIFLSVSCFLFLKISLNFWWWESENFLPTWNSCIFSANFSSFSNLTNCNCFLASFVSFHPFVTIRSMMMSSYASSYLLDAQKASSFNNVYEASRKGRSGEDCAKLYTACNETDWEKHFHSSHPILSLSLHPILSFLPSSYHSFSEWETFLSPVNWFFRKFVSWTREVRRMNSWYSWYSLWESLDTLDTLDNGTKREQTIRVKTWHFFQSQFFSHDPCFSHCKKTTAVTHKHSHLEHTFTVDMGTGSEYLVKYFLLLVCHKEESPLKQTWQTWICKWIWSQNSYLFIIHEIRL